MISNPSQAPPSPEDGLGWVVCPWCHVKWYRIAAAPPGPDHEIKCGGKSCREAHRLIRYRVASGQVEVVSTRRQ